MSLGAHASSFQRAPRNLKAPVPLRGGRSENAEILGASSLDAQAAALQRVQWTIVLVAAPLRQKIRGSFPTGLSQ